MVTLVNLFCDFSGMEVPEFSLSPKNGGNIVKKGLITFWLERKTLLLPKLMSEDLVFQVSCMEKPNFVHYNSTLPIFLALVAIFHKRGKKC